EANRKADHDPYQVARRLVDRPDVLHLRAGDACRDDDQYGDEHRPHGQAAEPDGLGHFAGSFHCVHWQLTWANCASLMNIYSSLSVSTRAPRSAERRLRRGESYPIRRGAKSRRDGGLVNREGGRAESARISVIRLG